MEPLAFADAERCSRAFRHHVVEFATLDWVAWYNGSRPLAPLGYVPPAEFERAYHDRQTAPVELTGRN